MEAVVKQEERPELVAKREEELIERKLAELSLYLKANRDVQQQVNNYMQHLQQQVKNKEWKQAQETLREMEQLVKEQVKKQTLNKIQGSAVPMHVKELRRVVNAIEGVREAIEFAHRQQNREIVRDRVSEFVTKIKERQNIQGLSDAINAIKPEHQEQVRVEILEQLVFEKV
jgi:ribosomal protein S20